MTDASEAHEGREPPRPALVFALSALAVFMLIGVGYSMVSLGVSPEFGGRGPDLATVVGLGGATGLLFGLMAGGLPVGGAITAHFLLESRVRSLRGRFMVVFAGTVVAVLLMLVGTGWGTASLPALWASLITVPSLLAAAAIAPWRGGFARG